MKKVLLLLGVAVVLSIGTVGLNSCSDDVKDAFGCLELASDLSSAYSDYLTNRTVGTCTDYKDAIQDYIDDCDELTATEISDYEADIAALDCDALDI